ncbi:MAG: cytochrome bc complex cytochrome b subunit [Nitrospinae bacterium]|nr:cytochrome bc complex cytochrome b subunit [Nitrospinota bacterium]
MFEKFKESLGINSFHYQIPSHGNKIPYTLGGITLISLTILFISGFILTQFYNPAVSDANRSILYIKNDVYLGWFIRGIHYWAVQTLTVTVSLHLIRVFMTAAYKKPREFTWLSGVLLLSLIGGFIFTGTVLKWDQEGYEALQHNLWVMGKFGIFGKLFSDDFSKVNILGRLYTVHISILPFLSILLLMVHLFLIKIHGISPVILEGDGRMVDFTSHIRKLIKYGIFTLLVVSVLAIVIEPPLGGEPVEGVEATKPPWMFLWLYSLENIWVYFLIVAPNVILLMLFLLPFIDRGSSIKLQERKVAITVFIIILLTMVGLIINGMITSAGHHME